VEAEQDQEEFWAWWHISVILALRRWRQEDCKFKASLGYIVTTCLKIKPTTIATKTR
jgi:hypothetical protein